MATLSLRRSLRTSSSNLSATNTEQNDNVQSDAKPYTLNKVNSLLKKIDSCGKNDITYILKSGNNLTLNFSTSAYELAKAVILQNTKTQNFLEKYNVQIEDSKDKNGYQVDNRFKIFGKKKDDNQKSYLKCSINCYYTKSSMLVNGRNLDIFEAEFFQDIQNRIMARKADIGKTNKRIQRILGQTVSELSGQTKFHQHMDCHESPKLNQSNQSQEKLRTDFREIRQISTQSNMTENLPSPIIENLQKDNENPYVCPKCQNPVLDNCIACDSCDEWFHFDCLNIEKGN